MKITIWLKELQHFLIREWYRRWHAQPNMGMVSPLACPAEYGNGIAAGSPAEYGNGIAAGIPAEYGNGIAAGIPAEYGNGIAAGMPSRIWEWYRRMASQPNMGMVSPLACPAEYGNGIAAGMPSQMREWYRRWR